MSISLACITLNRCMKLNRLLANSKDYVDEIIVVDGGSTDDTEKICKMHGAKMYVKKWENDFSAQRNFGLLKVTSDWVLILDDDEFLEMSVWGYLYDIIKNNNKDKVCYSISRKNYIISDENKYNINQYKDFFHFPDYLIRFFRKGMQFNGKKVHEGFDTTGYENIEIPIEYGSIIHEKSWEDQKKADIMYRQLENSYN